MRAKLLALALGVVPCVAEANVTILDAHGQYHGTGYVGLKKGSREAPHKFYRPSEEELAATPDVYDSRNDGGANYVAEVRDQGQCGSCWDFSMTKTLESARLVKGLPALDLSEQDALVNSGQYGCNGGTMDATYWVNHGLALESDCPYRANDNVSCDKPAADKGSSWGIVGASGRAPTEDELRAAIYKYKVLSVTVAAGGSDWSNGGKMTGCRSSGVNHMVNVIGYDCSANAVRDTLGVRSAIRGKKCVFFGRNSWGPDWGDHGDFYAVQGCDQLASTEDGALFIDHEGSPVPPAPVALPAPVLPLDVTIGSGDPLMLGTPPEAGVTYSWSTGGVDAMVWVLGTTADRVVTLTATNVKGKTEAKTNVHVVPK